VGAAVAGAVLLQSRSGGEAGPPTLEELKSGVGRVDTLNCDGTPFTVGGQAFTGTGFLIGSRVVMTAEHGMYVGVERPACRLRVRFGAETYAVTSVHVWGERGQRDSYARSGVDLATLMLARPVSDRHVFELAPVVAGTGTPVATLGYPLGGPLKVSRGTIYKYVVDYDVPSVATNLDVQGGNSGGPIFNDRGEILSVVSRIVISGSLTADKSNRNGGVDLPRWWGEDALPDLCSTHPNGGLPGCGEHRGGPTVKRSVRLRRPSR
jgi:Trypsin-like peptidase domain